MNEKELNYVRDLMAKIQSYEELLKNLRRTIVAKIPAYNGMPKGNSVDSAVERIGIRIADLTSKIDVLKQILTVEATTLEKWIITEIKSVRMQTILILRYIDGMTFGEIGRAMGYSEKHIRRLHKAFLSKLKKCDKMSADVRLMSVDSSL